MQALIFSTSEILINYIINSKRFERISVLAFTDKDFLVNKELISKIDSIDYSSSKELFSKKIKTHSSLSRCFTFGCPYIFKEDDIKHFEFPILNFHTGKIPENRGKTPLFWDIVNNETSSYGSLHAINSEIDMGIVLDVVETEVTNLDTPKTLANKLVQEIIKKGYILKWLICSKNEIIKKKKTIQKGNYKKPFLEETNYNSIELTQEFIERLWRCYSIWGKIKINGNFYYDISINQSNQNYIKLITLDKKYIYGRDKR